MDSKNLGLRKAVGIILTRKDGKIWTGKRKIGIGVRPNEKNLWQMPQGGIDIGETPEEAAFRELEEETGTKSAEIILSTNDWLEYNLPKDLLGKALKGKFKGQKQKWFLMLFKGNDKEFNLDKYQPEFDDWSWRELEEMPNLVVDFKKDLYLELVRKFSPIKEKLINY
jgi:putative (di)nucleoside polyphosphate hydrolase